MWQKLKEQIPAILITAALVIGAAAFMIYDIMGRQRTELAPLMAQNESLRAQADENRRQIAATNQILRDALAQSGGTLVQREPQVEKMSEERLSRLAEVIAQRVIPSIPVPQSASAVEAAQNEQVDKVAVRLAESIKPVLASAIAEQQAVTSEVMQDSQNRIRQLNVGLLATQAAARDALRLSREISELYGNSAKDEGVLMRLISLPASLVIDAANMHLVTGDRAKMQAELAAKSDEIEKRLREVQALAGDSGS